MKLRLMMFMQFLLFAVWWVPLAAYLTLLDIEGLQKTIILSSMAIGAMASPVICAFADRRFSAQKVLSVSNVVTGVMLLLASLTTSVPLLILFILTAMIFYMPTWSLTSTIAMAHSTPETFPRIRLFGTLGWVASGVFSLIALNVIGMPEFDGTVTPLIVGGVLCFIAAVINIFLPDTPPQAKKEKQSVASVLGFNSISMLKDRNYAVFMLCSFLAMIPFALYVSFGSEFLLSSGFKYITITLNWGQAAEVIFLFFTTTIITKVGIKNAMILGLVALILRYAAFLVGVETGMENLYFIGILVHGLIFGLFFVGGQVYTEKIAPDNLKAQAQGLLSFATWGVGCLIGNVVAGAYIAANTFVVDGVKTYDWGNIFSAATIFSAAVAVLFIILFKNKR